MVHRLGRNREEDEHLDVDVDSALEDDNENDLCPEASNQRFKGARKSFDD
jgi:hypothetical protein